MSILLIESIVAVFTIIMACIYSKNIEYATGILTAFITFSAILVKLHISSTIKTLKLKIESNHNIILKINKILINSDGRKKQFAIDILNDAVESILKSEMKVNTDDYFRLIKENIKNSKRCKIYAICCIDELLNQTNKSQEEYLKANIDAATYNNVNIHRKFILPENIISAKKKSKQLDTILKQWKTENIKIGIIEKNKLGNQNQPEDWVLFSSPYNELFVSVAHSENVNKIESAKRIINDKTIENYLNSFENLERYEWGEKKIKNFFTEYQKNEHKNKF